MVVAGLVVINNGKTLWVDNGEAHNIVIGATGSGKTQAVVFPLVQSLAKRGESMIITDPKGEIYEQLVEAMDDENAIYQWRRKYVRKNKSGVVPTLTANQGEGGHNVCLIKTSHGIRKMTPHECFNTQGFPKKFKLPKDMSDARLYKQAGNSVCVSVIKRIAEKIEEAYV